MASFFPICSSRIDHQRPSRGRTRALHLGLLLTLAMPASALEVTARLEAGSVRLGESVRLILETDGQPDAGPDLSPLQQDFRIAGRSSSRQVTEVNGQRSERHELRLTLIPLRAGQLEIPSISYGEVASQPLRLEVAEGPASQTPLAQTPRAPLPPAQIPPWGAYPESLPSPPARAETTAPLTFRDWPAPPLPAAASPPPWSPPASLLEPSPGLGFPPPADWRRADSSPWAPAAPRPEPMMPETPAERNSVEGGTRPAWLLAFAALPLLLLAGWAWRRFLRRPTSRGDLGQGTDSPLAETPSPPLTRDPTAEAIEEVRRAYEGGEALTARDALLAWAALVLPDRPPSNLALLAKRCHEPLRGEILLLEQAFFSPHPLDWDRRRVWERLANFDPLPPEEPASFRQKKPLRRPTAPS